jgi:hypothetical protein
MATHFERLYNALSYDLEFYLTVNLDRTHWEEHNKVREHDMQTVFEIIQDLFQETEPDIQYMCMVALRCTLIRPYPHDAEDNPYACEAVYELAVRNVQHVLADHRQRLIQSLHAAHHSAFVIQKQWKKCIANPEYQMCKDRLMREYNELGLMCPRLVNGIY